MGSPCLLGQRAYTWQELRDRFEAANPTLKAAQVNVEETRAQEITAYLRPNPDVSVLLDQFEPFVPNPYRPFSQVLESVGMSYLHERRHKRELRLEVAKQGTAIAASQLEDQRRMLLYNLRNAFVQLLQAKAVKAMAEENLQQYDKVIDLNRSRKQAGDIAQVDLDRIELQKVQFLSDLQTADVNLRTAKINLLTLLNDRTPAGRFDVSGNFDFNETLPTLDELRQIALAARPDLKAAIQTVDQAQASHRLAVANGSTDPTFGIDVGRNPPGLSQYIGLSMSVPLRIFDRNQGEKLRTTLDVRRNERLRDATEAQVFGDVDSAYATLNNTLTLLRPYKSQYLQLSTRVRDTINYSFQRGAASLIDFLQAQQDYRAVQVAYLNLVGSYLTAASQLNLAVGQEVIQ